MIVITTMDSLPEQCFECPCHNGESGYCQADKSQRYSDYRPFWCPLKEIDRCNDCKHENEKMKKEEIIRRLKKISEHAVHAAEEPPFILSLDDGIALNEAVRLLKEQEAEYENGFNDAMLGKQELMYEGIDGKWHKKDW